MRAALLLATALPTLLAAAPGLAQRGAPAARAAPAQSWLSEVRLVRVFEREYQRADPLDWTDDYWSRRLGPLVTVGDIPADLRRRTVSSEVLIAVALDAAGNKTGCTVLRAGAEPRLDALACRLVMERASFRPTLAGPGRPVASRRILGIRFETVDAETHARRLAAQRPIRPPPAPPPPPFPSGWPRLNWSEQLRVERLPGIQADYPRRSGRPAEGVVSLELFTSPAGEVRCEIGFGSGNAALDAAACGVAGRLELSYTWPCDDWCGSARLPLQVVWRRRGSHIRLPLPGPRRTGDRPPPPRDPADRRAAQSQSYSYERPRLVLTADDFRRLADRTLFNPMVRLDLLVDEQGRVRRCVVPRGSGNEAVDRRVCALAAERLRFPVRTDIFGDPVPNEISYYMVNLPALGG
jgi:outer membrane biosynthesis protein TonB